MESHYTGKDTHRRYLESSLNIRKMYNRYRENVPRKMKCHYQRESTGIFFVQSIICLFFSPKKDQCTQCNAYQMKQVLGVASESDERSFNDNSQRKNVLEKRSPMIKKLQRELKTYIVYRLISKQFCQLHVQVYPSYFIRGS